MAAISSTKILFIVLSSGNQNFHEIISSQDILISTYKLIYLRSLKDRDYEYNIRTLQRATLLDIYIFFNLIVRFFCVNICVTVILNFHLLLLKLHQSRMFGLGWETCFGRTLNWKLKLSN